MSFSYEYPRPSVSTDCVVFSAAGGTLQVLLIQRAHDPFSGHWALPGGFLEMDEDLETCARRELLEETGLHTGWLEQLHTFGDVNRDPRGRVISVGWLALVDKTRHVPIAGDDAAAAGWFSVNQLPKLAFDHDQFIALARRRLHDKAQRQPAGLDVLPGKFSLFQLRQFYEALLNRSLESGPFRRVIMKTGHIVRANPKAARKTLFRFDRLRYRSLTRSGFGKDLFPR
jgi:8-oxo-dGTP diphosphatase